VVTTVRKGAMLAIPLALSLALAAPPVAAQSDEVNPASPGINAGKVDGKHAVGSGASPAKRAKKLVATDASGFLPSDIVRPLWSLIQGIPAILTDGQITFAEIAAKPAGFADNVDNGIISMNVQQVVGPAFALAAGGNGSGAVACPAGSTVVSGGFSPNNFLVAIVTSFRSGNGWIVAAHNNAAVAAAVFPIAYCMTTNPAGGVTISKKAGKGIKKATANRPPMPRRK
jgi:hypothetical protein